MIKKNNSNAGRTIIYFFRSVYIHNLHGKKIILHSENPRFPRFIADNNFRIEGIVKSVFQYN